MSSFIIHHHAKHGKEILVVGASGKTGQTIVKDLLSHKNINITVTIRQHSPDGCILSDSRVRAVPYQDRYQYLDRADCIISATASPHYIFTCSEVEKHIHTPKKRLFIDLAVPHDIDREIAGLAQVSLIDIDYFRTIAADHNSKKLHSAELAEKWIAVQCEEVQKSLALQNFLAEYQGKQDLAFLYPLRSTLSAEQFFAVLDAIKKE